MYTLGKIKHKLNRTTRQYSRFIDFTFRQLDYDSIDKCKTDIRYAYLGRDI